MDKDKVLEGILTTKLLSGDFATFMTELFQLNITPSEARTMDIFGDAKIGELVAKLLEAKDDPEASQPVLTELHDYLQKSSDVTAKDEPQAAPAEAEVEKKADEAKDTLEKNADKAVIKPEDMAVPEIKMPEEVDYKVLFSEMEEKIEKGFADVKDAIANMQETLKEVANPVEMPKVGDEAEVKMENFSAEDEADEENKEDTPVEEGKDMENTEKKDKEFDILREMIFDLMPADKKEAWAKRYAEAMGKDVCPECGDSKEEFCDKTFDDEPEAEEKKDEVKEAMVDLIDALKDLRDELKKEDEPKAEEAKEESHKEDVEEPKKEDEGLTEDEIKAIEGESTNFSQKPANKKVDVYSYLYG